MTNKIKKILIITLVICFCLISLVHVSETAQSGNQEEVMEQVLKDAADQLAGQREIGWYGSTYVHREWWCEGGCCHQGVQEIKGDSFWEYKLEICRWSTESEAAGYLETQLETGYRSTSFHGYPVGICTMFQQEQGLSALIWQSGRFTFYVDATNKPVKLGAEILYSRAVGRGLIARGGGTTQDSDGDGVSDDIDQCPNTSAGVAVDENGCAIVKEMSLTVSTDKKAYSAGETIIIHGSVSDTQGELTGATVAIDVNGTKLTPTTDSSGKYRCEYPLPDNISQGIYTVKATASKSDYPNTSKNTSFAVGEISIQLEENHVTGEPFIGITADGVSSLRISISLPGCSDVKVGRLDVGELKGDAINFLGSITLDSAGMAEITYYPPDYLTKNQLTQNLDVHQSNSRTWVAEVPLTFTYTDASEQEGKIEGKILVCRPPVMLVHGFLGASTTWGKMSTYLRGEKFDPYMGNYGATGQSIEGLSLILKNDIRKQQIDYANSNIKMAKVDVVGHSMGGLIARYYTHGLTDYPEDVRKLIMVGTPNHGVSWTKKVIGNVATGWYETHKIPAGQLHSQSSFMKTLNSGEKTGAQLNSNIQYGNIYGYSDDWVVSAASAYLNGVDSVLEFDVKHSPDIPGVPDVAITEYLKTWDRVKSWLTQDIYKPPLKGSHAEVYKYEGDVYLDETKLASSPTKIDSWQSLRTGQDSKAIVHLTINDSPWGIIFLDPDSEIFLGYLSPQLVEVRLWKGSATFRSRKDGHFTVPVNIKRSEDGEWWKYSPQAVVTGQGTEFAITAGENIEVHCLEGELVMDTPNTTEEGTILSANDSVAVKGKTVTAISPASKDNFWWSTEEDHFLDSTPGSEWLDKFKDFIDNPFINYISVEVRKITIAAVEKLKSMCPILSDNIYQMLPDNIRQMLPESISRNLLYIIVGFFVLILFLLIKILRGRR
ncbi:MAG: alpha/beta fold hydrolase [Caldisericota bacterium]|nr:alpha/beta fold hydrolase [Caldisericota bacterium]